MFAVIRTGGKQYRVAPNDVIQIERIAGNPGDIVELAEVMLLAGGEGGPKTGAPLVSGALVAAEVLEQGRGPKITVFKKIRRKNHRRTKGHRQLLTTVRITEILTDGKKPSKAAAGKAQAKTESKAEKKSKPEAAEPAKQSAASKRAAPKKAEAKAPRSAAPKKTAAKKTEAKRPSRAKPKK